MITLTCAGMCLTVAFFFVPHMAVRGVELHENAETCSFFDVFILCNAQLRHACLYVGLLCAVQLHATNKDGGAKQTCQIRRTSSDGIRRLWIWPSGEVPHKDFRCCFVLSSFFLQLHPTPTHRSEESGQDRGRRLGYWQQYAFVSGPLVGAKTAPAWLTSWVCIELASWEVVAARFWSV